MQDGGTVIAIGDNDPANDQTMPPTLFAPFPTTRAAATGPDLALGQPGSGLTMCRFRKASIGSALKSAQTGDPVTLVQENKRWHLKDAQGQSLGRMARSFEPPSNSRFVRGEIAAILQWRKEYGDEAFHHTLKRDVWEVVIPELVFQSL